jgi:hypothetical protein
MVRLVCQRKKPLPMAKVKGIYFSKIIAKDFLIEKDKLTIFESEFFLFWKKVREIIKIPMNNLLESCSSKMKEVVFNYQAEIGTKILRPVLAVLFCN